MLGRVPLFPLFLKGNDTATKPHKLQHLRVKGSALQFGTADAAAADGREGSNVYEVKPSLWQFGRGRPRIGGLSVSESEERRYVVVRAGAKRSHETWPQRGRQARRRMMHECL